MGYVPTESDYEAERHAERLWQLQRRVGRRRFLELMGLAGAGLVATACRGSGNGNRAGGTTTTAGGRTTGTAATNPGGWVKPVPEATFIHRTTNAEMRWERMAGKGYVTPNGSFFIRNHTSTPAIDRGTWRLRVEGSGVDEPTELTYDDLLGLGAETTVTRALECAGCARVFFAEDLGREASGTQWRLGAIGVAEWTGVPLGAVLERAGVKASARDVMPVGLDDLMVRRPMPLDKAMADDTLLVYAMGSDDLPPDHGGPVRALLPGWIGSANVKWVGSLEVSEEPLYSDWNTSSYVLIGPGYEPEGPAQGPILTTQVVKSALELPWPARVPAGSGTLTGRSWSGRGAIRTVDVRVDDGPWQPARLRDPNEARAWVRWSFDWDATTGERKIRVRATDDQGNTQPDTVPFNEKGYLYGAVVAHPVIVT